MGRGGGLNGTAHGTRHTAHGTRLTAHLDRKKKANKEAHSTPILKKSHPTGLSYGTMSDRYL